MQPDNTYDESFYETLNISSEISSEVYIDYLFKFIKPSSVIDLGCGYAAWLKACKKFGSTSLTGVDGIWNDGKYVKELGFDFVSMDLDNLDDSIKKHDLAISLEVAEHLKPKSSEIFIKNLTNVADLVLFSAAFTNQGGTNHINERNPSFWGQLFEENDFVAFDLFREKFWDDERVGFWYRQNCFLYCKKASKSYEKLKDQGVREIKNLYFLDCVHPNLYLNKCGEGIGFAAHAKGIFPSFIRALKRVLTKKK